MVTIRARFAGATHERHEVLTWEDARIGAHDQRTAVAVMVAFGTSGSGTAGPLVEAYLR